MVKKTKSSKVLLITLIILNIVVLAGQLWPDGAPPFAPVVNILFLTLNVIFLVYITFRS